MSRSNLTSHRTDWPTLVLHWGLVAALLLSVLSGWRIASLNDGSSVMSLLALQGNVVRWHFFSAAGLVALVLAYLVFLWRTDLFARLRVRLAALRSPDRQTRWQAVNRLVYWVAFVLLGGAAATGSLLYFVPGTLPTEALAGLHRWLSWAFVAYIAVHVLAQLMLGGLRQVLKMLTPRAAYGVGALAALSAGLAGAAALWATDSGTRATLVLARASAAPVLDGDPTDAVWLNAAEAVVHTARGHGLQGGEVDVHIRALHDDTQAWFLFRWRDATRSQKHVPLQKTEQGWKLLHTNYFKNDENEFYEDKFAVMLARSPVAGGNTVRLGAKPFADRPGPSNGMGLHVAAEGELADVWHWKSVRSGALDQFDDNYFGPKMDAGKGRYTGGYTQDPKTGGGFEQNFERIADTNFVKLKYLPRDLATQQQRMGRFDPNPEASDGGSYAMHVADTVPYSAEADGRIPVGTVIPSVVFDKPFSGDRGDVRVVARWKDGWWTLEARRLLDTRSKFDQPIVDGMYLWVSVFDHNQIRHTRHVQPLRLSLQ
jgi:hypothetical protein